MSLRLQEVMTAITQLYYRPLPTVFKAEHSDLRSQVMATFVMVLSGRVTSVVEMVLSGRMTSVDRGSCPVSYGGQYNTTEGFVQHSCSSDIKSGNKIGFWCDWSGDGAVMMIGGGGSDCIRADHGVGITEENEAKFVSVQGFDFGFDSSSRYTLQHIHCVLVGSVEWF